MFTHVLLEVYCGINHRGELDASEAASCKAHNYTPSYDCLFKKCPYVTFTSCENAICYSNETSEAEEIIAFGGEMEEGLDEASIPEAIDLWKKISAGKIHEAYDAYMAFKNEKAKEY